MKQVVSSTGGSARGRVSGDMVPSKHNDLPSSQCLCVAASNKITHTAPTGSLCKTLGSTMRKLNGPAALTLQFRRPDRLSLHQV